MWLFFRTENSHGSTYLRLVHLNRGIFECGLHAGSKRLASRRTVKACSAFGEASLPLTTITIIFVGSDYLMAAATAADPKESLGGIGSPKRPMKDCKSLSGPIRVHGPNWEPTPKPSPGP